MSAALRNVQDGIGLVRTAEDALQEVSGIFVRMKELVIASLDDALSDSDRSPLNAEYQQLADEVMRVIGTTEFNGIGLLDSNTTIAIQVGTESDETIDIDRTNMSIFGAIVAFFPLTSKPTHNIANLLADIIIPLVADIRGDLGAVRDRLENTQRRFLATQEHLASAESRIADAASATETAQRTRSQILQQGAVSVLTQANASPTLALKLLEL